MMILALMSSAPEGVQGVVASEHLLPQDAQLLQHGLVGDAPFFGLIDDDAKPQQQPLQINTVSESEESRRVADRVTTLHRYIDTDIDQFVKAIRT
uniref:Uncharacterized protein n=1 Tax=Oryza barthii TaxID=65489 RepID=A0A0D3GLM6_9ORYZ